MSRMRAYADFFTALALCSSGMAVMQSGGYYIPVKDRSTKNGLNQRQKRKRWASNPHLRNK